MMALLAIDGRQRSNCSCIFLVLISKLCTRRGDVTTSDKIRLIDFPLLVESADLLV